MARAARAGSQLKQLAFAFAQPLRPQPVAQMQQLQLPLSLGKGALACRWSFAERPRPHPERSGGKKRTLCTHCNRYGFWAVEGACVAARKQKP